MQHFMNDRKRTPSWGPKIDAEVQRYVDGLAHWVVANLEVNTTYLVICELSLKDFLTRLVVFRDAEVFWGGSRGGEEDSYAEFALKSEVHIEICNTRDPPSQLERPIMYETTDTNRIVHVRFSLINSRNGASLRLRLSKIELSECFYLF